MSMKCFVCFVCGERVASPWVLERAGWLYPVCSRPGTREGSPCFAELVRLFPDARGVEFAVPKEPCAIVDATRRRTER